MIRKWDQIGETVKLAGKFGKALIVKMFQNPKSGKVDEYVLLVQRDWSIVLAIDKDDQVLVVQEYKQGRDCVGYELPAGTAEFGEEPEVVMRRELLEETGYEAGDVRYLGSAWMSTRNSPSKGHLFLATGCHKVADQKLDEGEDIETKLIPLAKWIEMVVDGEIEEWSSALATIRALPHLGLKITAG